MDSPIQQRYFLVKRAGDSTVPKVHYFLDLKNIDCIFIQMLNWLASEYHKDRLYWFETEQEAVAWIDWFCRGRKTKLALRAQNSCRVVPRHEFISAFQDDGEAIRLIDQC